MIRASAVVDSIVSAGLPAPANEGQARELAKVPEPERAEVWLELPNLRSVLRRKAERGCRVRFLVGDPDSEVTRRREEAEGVPLTVSTRIRITLAELAKLDGTPGLEARFGDEHIAMSVFRFDDQMLVTPHLARLVGHDSPMLHLRRMQDDGLFDRFAFHVSELWGMGRPVELGEYATPPE